MKQLYEKVQITHVPLEEETIIAHSTTVEEIMSSEYRTLIMRRLTVRQQMLFLLWEGGYKDHEITKSFKMTMPTIWNLRYQIRLVCEEIKKNGYN